MSNKPHVGIHVPPELHETANQIARTIVETTSQTEEYRGMGGHSIPENTPPHGPHTQISIGLNDKTVDFRKMDR